MSHLNLERFASRHLDAAADLVCRSYTIRRGSTPLLSESLEEPDYIRELIARWAEESTGLVALNGAQLIGFLLGRQVDLFSGEKGIFASEWVDRGARAHLISFFADETESINALYQSGFGLHLKDGVRDLSEIPSGLASGYEIRRTDPTDAKLIEPLERALFEHFVAPPIFLHPHREWKPRFDAGWLEDESNGLWLATCDGIGVGFISCHPANPGAEPVSLRIPSLLSINGAFRTLEGPEIGARNFAAVPSPDLGSWRRVPGVRGRL